MQPQHARIVASMKRKRLHTNGRVRTVNRPRYFLENLSQGPCKVNGCPLEKGQKMRLFDHAKIRIGDYAFQYRNRGARREGG